MAASVSMPLGGVQVATYDDYQQAQRAVDFLSDEKFPVENVTIIGSDLRMVERVTGRMTWGRAIGAGAASGAWFGLLVGLLLGLFSPDSSWFAVLIGSTLIGAFWGAVFAFLAHRATGGRHDFASLKTLEAEQYAVYVDADHADDAIRLAGLL